MTLLKVDNVTKRFAGLTAVDSCSFSVEQGAVHALIGPNGAGKTTMFNMIGGALAVSDGAINFDGQDLAGTLPHDRMKMGIARTFQLISLFKEMNVIENVMAGAYCRTHSGILASMLNLPSARREAEATKARALELLDFVGLGDSVGAGLMLAGSLSYGEQRILEIARALAGDPKLILLDEPAAGMNPTEKIRLSDTIRQIANKGVTVLIVEHDMQLVMGVADKITVLDHGVRIAEGLPKDIQNDPEVIRAYIGEGAEQC